MGVKVKMKLLYIQLHIVLLSSVLMFQLEASNVESIEKDRWWGPIKSIGCAVGLGGCDSDKEETKEEPDNCPAGTGDVWTKKGFCGRVTNYCGIIYEHANCGGDGRRLTEGEGLLNVNAISMVGKVSSFTVK